MEILGADLNSLNRILGEIIMMMSITFQNFKTVNIK